MAPRGQSSHALEGLDERLRALLDRLPREPGVYLLRDKRGTIIYVGKAKDLFSRVRSYFTRSGDERAFVPLLGHLLGDVETIVTDNEKEALLLENNLIKRHKPRFNVMLRDDKNFLVLRLDPGASYPRLEVLRQIRDDAARYFGPYHSASACRATLRIVNRYFQLRTCTDRTMQTRTRPCLQYQIGRCPAPCVFAVDEQQYERQVEDVTLFLRGRGEELIASLEERMRAAADRLDYEYAAHLRDQIEAVRRTLQRQQVVGHELVDRDAFGFYREGDAVEIAVLTLREGKLVGRQPFSFTGQEFPGEELLSSFVTQYYDGGAHIPDQVLVPFALEDVAAKSQWLSELAGHRVEILTPRRGDKRRLLELAGRNALHAFRSHRQRDADVEQALAKLQRRLRLEQLPRRIECYDISQLMGEQVVGSMVVMQDGEPERASYRRFNVQGEVTDDFAAMYQVMVRRLRRARERDSGWELPQLIVVDGGKGQLSSALAALKDVELPPDLPRPDLVGLAKERAGPDASGADRPDRVFVPQVKDPIRLRSHTAELFMLSRLRDEAHRFAISHHKARRRRRALRSSLDDIPGIGAKRKRALLRELGSLRRIREASVDELRAVRGMTQRAAESVARYFRAGEPAEPPAAQTDGAPERERA